MPVEFGPHQPGDRLPGHDQESWPAWHCDTCGQEHESDPRQGCVGFKRATPQPTFEELQGREKAAAIHGEIANNPVTGRRPGVSVPSLADRIAAGVQPSANPVLLDSIRMIVREEIKASFIEPRLSDKDKHAIAEGLRTVVLFFVKNGRSTEDDEQFPTVAEIEALIQRMES